MAEQEDNLHEQEIGSGDVVQDRNTFKVHKDGEGADLVTEQNSLIPQSNDDGAGWLLEVAEEVCKDAHKRERE